jgi:hypothetical protein
VTARLHLRVYVTRWLQKLESDIAAELTTKHCVDIAVFIPDEFAADADAFSQRMPQVLCALAHHDLHVHVVTSNVVCSCLSTAMCC